MRFDYNLLDLVDPFEIDDRNRPHLHKHLPRDDTGRYISIGVDDIYVGYWDGDPSYYEADEAKSADWLMLAQIPGLVICVALAAPHSGVWRKCRPIGLDKAHADDRRKYLEGE